MDVAEQTMFDRVVSRAVRGLVRHTNVHTDPFGKPTQTLAESWKPIAIATAAIRQDEQAIRIRVAILPHPLPPSLNTVDG